MMRDERGQVAEAGFVFLALLHGLSVWRPVNPQLKFDFIVEVATGRTLKVQVKSAWVERGIHRVNLTKKRHGKTERKTYKYGDYDYLAVFNQDERDFWIFPASLALQKTAIWCRTTSARCTHGFDTAVFWRQWDVFNGV